MKTDYEKFITGPLDVNTYVIRDDDGNCLIVDPSSGCSNVLDYIKGESLTLCAIVLTHGHFDHILGIPEVLVEFPITPVYVHGGDREMLTSPLLNGSVLFGEKFSFSGDVRELVQGDMKIGTFSLCVLHVPGHSPGGCALLIESVCFCGDIIFAGSVGRTDLPGGSSRSLMSGIREKILILPDETVLCPGHGGRTTVSREKRVNPFLQEFHD